MKRIGITASKMAKGNLFLYNLFVILIASIFSLFIFVLAGSTVLLSLIIIVYAGNQITSFEFSYSWSVILTLCMIALTVMLTFFLLFAVSVNMKFSLKSKPEDAEKN